MDYYQNPAPPMQQPQPVYWQPQPQPQPLQQPSLHSRSSRLLSTSISRYSSANRFTSSRDLCPISTRRRRSLCSMRSRCRSSRWRSHRSSSQLFNRLLRLSSTLRRLSRRWHRLCNRCSRRRPGLSRRSLTPLPRAHQWRGVRSRERLVQRPLGRSISRPCPLRPPRQSQPPDQASNPWWKML
jgi:hypothetical protein